MRRYEFVEGTSSKFWEIDLEGESFVTRWGRIGTDGQEKSQDFDSAADARKAHDKLVGEKEKKGYKLVGGDEPEARPLTAVAIANPDMEAALAADRDDEHAWTVYADWLIEHGESWGEVIAAACAGKAAVDKQVAVQKALLEDAEGVTVVWKRGVIEELTLEPNELDDDNPMEAVLARVIRHPAGRLMRTLRLGLPPSSDGDIDWSMEVPVKALAGHVLPILETLDMRLPSEHMDQPSWRRVGDVRGIWKSAPRLKRLELMGSNGSDGGTALELGPIDAPELETLIIESSGLDSAAPKDIAAGKLPKLRHLELYFGVEDYGCTSTVESLAGILGGKNLPSLTTLGLKNSEWQADLIEAVAKSAVLPRLTTLDFSMGVMSVEAASSLQLHAHKLAHLEQLDLSDNYFTDVEMAAIAKALPNAVFGEQKEPDEDGEDSYRYPTVGE